MYGETGDAELDIRYWDDEDFVSLSRVYFFLSLFFFMSNLCLVDM